MQQSISYFSYKLKSSYSKSSKGIYSIDNGLLFLSNINLNTSGEFKRLL